MKATNFEPFLINTPEHIPHTLLKVNSYRFREDAGGGGRSESFAAGGGVTTGGGACCDAGSGNTSVHSSMIASASHTVAIDIVQAVRV